MKFRQVENAVDAINLPLCAQRNAQQEQLDTVFAELVEKAVMAHTLNIQGDGAASQGDPFLATRVQPNSALFLGTFKQLGIIVPDVRAHYKRQY